MWSARGQASVPGRGSVHPVSSPVRAANRLPTLSCPNCFFHGGGWVTQQISLTSDDKVKEMCLQ